MTAKRGDAGLEVVPRAGPAVPPPEAFDPGDGDEVSLGEYLDVLLKGRWIVAASVALALAAGVAYALLAPPIYRTDALVQVEDKKGGMGGLSDLSALMGESSPAETEIEILRSRALVGAVVDALRLDLVARPRRFPLLGGAIARRWDGEGPRAAMLGLGRFGWGGERISVSRLDVPPALQDEPLTLVARDCGRYEVRDPDGALVVEGQVGQAAAGNGVELFVAELAARPGTEFRVTHVPRSTAVADLQEDLQIAEKGKKTGILKLALEGRDPEQIAAILDALSTAYLRQNVERKSAEAQKTLEFLDGQLPVIRSTLDEAEHALQVYRSAKGSVDVSMEAQAAITRAAEIEKAATELKVEFVALRQRFTEEHPALVAVKQKLQRLDGERASLETRLKKLPASELESARRLRDVKVANELYLTLLNKAQELRVVKEGTIGNVRILDAAVVPLKPIAPRKTAVVALSLVLGLGLGVALAFVRHALDHGVEDPDLIEAQTGIAVHASIAHSELEAADAERARREKGAPALLAAVNPKDLAVEGLRSLRTSLQFALFEARTPVVAIGGPAPGVGKSFVTGNLAHLLGEAGKRILVIDGDLRRGHLHRVYGGDRGPGLSDVLRGDQTIAEAIRDSGSPNVRFLPTGTIPPNPAELLGSERFQRLVADLAGQYDVVLIDAPPILAVTDAALIGRLAGVNLFVLKAAHHPMREISAALRQLARSGVRVQGFVMNGVRVNRGLGRRNAYHYQYTYE
jgi:tyrosine-protein kinase Etk/Wzc